ncbi:MAG: peptide deformylase [Clostridia bacterium]|nr:peptide deformylase [Clostridia bacterium]
MVREVVQLGDPVLRETCKPITRFDHELAALLDDLKDTVKKEQGAGLAAPQIGVPVRVAVVDVEEGFFEFINPVFVWQKGEQVGPEGCLSIRGKMGTVRRPDKVKVIFQDRKGDKYSLVARGFFARAICHEFDHLDGVVYTDKATDIRNSED